MSRVAKSPVTVPAGAEVKFGTEALIIRDESGELSFPLHSDVVIELNNGKLTFATKDGSKQANAMSDTVRALVNNMVKGVSEGFEKKLQLIGMSCRAQAQGKILNLSLGFPHPIVYEIPEGVSIQTPNQTEIALTGADKQVVGQVATEIRALRSPEPYEGKGVRYVGEMVVMKEAKKEQLRFTNG